MKIIVHFDSWGRFAMAPPRGNYGVKAVEAKVEKETPKCYRARFQEEWPRGSALDLVYVPKWAAVVQESVKMPGKAPSVPVGASDYPK